MMKNIDDREDISIEHQANRYEMRSMFDYQVDEQVNCEYSLKKNSIELVNNLKRLTIVHNRND